jgi:hypothetical protein
LLAGVFGGIINEGRKPGEGFSVKSPTHDFHYVRSEAETQVENYI